MTTLPAYGYLWLLTELLSGLATGAARVVIAVTVALTIVLIQVQPLALLFHLEPLHFDDWVRALGGALLSCCPLVLQQWRPGRHQARSTVAAVSHPRAATPGL